MEFQNLVLEKAGGKAKITLNRPQALNALNPELLSQLKAALEQVGEDKDIGVVILKGAGRSFCAGLDLKVIEKLLSEEEELRFVEQGREVFKIMEEMGKPIIAAVHGHAITGGFALVYFSDIIVASEDALFQDTHGRWGFVPAWLEAQRLPRVVGIFRAKGIFFTSDMITAKEAEQMGLVYKVVPREKLDEEAEQLATKILRQSRESLALIKAQINRGTKVEWSTALEIDSSIRKGLISDWITQEAKSRLKAFVEKREV